MKLSKVCSAFSIAFFVCLYAYGAPKTFDKKTSHKIAELSKVWGLMKYYHSEVAAGSINWDSVFVAYLPKVASSKNQQDFEKLMDDFYKQVPAPKLAKHYSMPIADTVFSIFQENEINGYHVSANLKKDLINIYQLHLPTKSKYITNKYKEYTLDYVLFTEDTKESPAYPDQAERLLALARYWNAINFFYPHKQSIGKNWERVLEDYIPVFADAPNELAYHQAILRINKELQDSHTFVNSPVINGMWGPNPHFTVSHIEGKFVISKLQSDSLAKAEDIRVGDVLESINGVSVKKRAKELWPLLAGSNDAATYRDIANYLLNIDANSFTTIEINRNGKHLTRKVSRYPYQQLVKLSDKPKQQDKLWREVTAGVMYVDYTKIRKPELLEPLFKDLQHAHAVIIDLRGYPNFQVYEQTLPALYTKDFHVSNTSNALVDYPGIFSLSKSMYERTDTSKLLPYTGSLIVLVNETTQSLPESFAMGLAQRPNTVIMGSQTAGTTGNITWLPLPGGANVAFTGVGEHGINGTFEQRKGVRIDKVVKPTIASVVAGKDAVLDAAVSEAKKGLKLKAEVNR